MTTLGTDAQSATTSPQRAGFLGFLGTIPGILTAVAGLVTAFATLYAVHVSSRPPEQLTESAQPAPDASVDPDVVATQADSAPTAGDTVLADETDALLNDCADGYLDSCVALLDVLVDDCYYGDPYACDVLYWISPIGSDYEAYGATCGGRFDWLAGRCSEL
jgi:hypothetical protein